jgi:hypothetical protein
MPLQERSNRSPSSSFLANLSATVLNYLSNPAALSVNSFTLSALLNSFSTCICKD